MEDPKVPGPGGPNDGADPPIDPIVAMAAAAIQLHELYLAYGKAGFTDSQAMQMVCAVIEAHLRA